jgi:hypothetical protein
MSRDELLLKALKEDFTQQQLNEFYNYRLSNSDLEFVVNVVKQTLQHVEPKAFDCALLSALVTAHVRDHSNIPIALIGGDLNYKGLPLFKHSENLNLKAANKNIVNGEFDGHFWVEIAGLIIDPSIFRTLYSNRVSEVLTKEIDLKFGKGKGCIFATPEELIKKYDFEYIPRYSLSDATITGLIKGFFNHRLKQ